MWYQPPHQLYGIQSPHKTEVVDSDAHGHSPCYRDKYKDETGDLVSQNLPLSSHGYIPPPGLRSHGSLLEDPYLSLAPILPDPFVDNERHPKSKKEVGLQSSEDQSMPDYSRSITPASSLLSLSSHTVGPISCSPPPEESQFEALMAAFSPHKESISGTFAPTNTRVTSQVNTPPVQSRSSTMAESRNSSYSHRQSRPTSINARDPPSLSNCRSSDENMHSYGIGFAVAPVEHFEMKKNPAKVIKGRKEGRTSDLEISAGIHKASSKRSNSSHEQENHRDGEDKSNTISDAKRKRGGRILATRSAFKSEANTSPSPSRKFSKTGSRDVIDSDDRDDVLISTNKRSPLLMLENIH